MINQIEISALETIALIIQHIAMQRRFYRNKEE